MLSVVRGRHVLSLGAVAIAGCGAAAPRTATTPGRPEALFSGAVGENIVSQSYRQIVTRFGIPLKTFAGAAGQRCAYYQAVGRTTGWVFCFKHGAMVSADGSQAPPAGVP